MNTWFRKVGVGALALTLAGVLGGCNNGNGGLGGLIRLYFGINGSGNCTSVIVEVNLEEANAVIARDSEGDLQCDLADALENAGCDITFAELENGDLRATISGCTIPGVAALFSCLFEEVDISELQETAFGQCSCTTQNCDGTPPVCISEDPDPTSCEDCDNGVDDDGNGLVDCEDPNCENSPACEATTTTSTTSTSTTGDTTTSSSTTTTSSSTTTSSTIPLDVTCRIVFRLADDVTVGALQWDVDYGDAPGEFLGQGQNVECATLVTGTEGGSVFNDKESEEVVSSGIIKLPPGFEGPLDIAECTFVSTVPVVEEDFVVTTVDAATPGDDEVDPQPIDPLPDVVIQSIECEGVVTTTTIPGETTTTEAPVTTTTTVGPANYNVLFSLTSGGPFGALQFEVDYSGAPGEFQGSADTVSCTPDATLPFTIPNDLDAQDQLNVGVISIAPFSAPKNIITCVFNGSAGDPPVPGDFGITVVDPANFTGNIGITVTPIP